MEFALKTERLVLAADKYGHLERRHPGRRVLTYGGVFLFEREPGMEWLDALQGIPTVVSRTGNRRAEAVTFNAAGDALLIALEQRNSPLFRLPIGSDTAAVTVMAFNVENVFDNVDDPDKIDETYLPIGEKQADAHIAKCNEIPVERWRDSCLYLDWSDAVIDHKLAVVAATIQQVNNGRGPDIVALQEVENVGILDRLRSEYLADSGLSSSCVCSRERTRAVSTSHS